MDINTARAIRWKMFDCVERSKVLINGRWHISYKPFHLPDTVSLEERTFFIEKGWLEQCRKGKVRFTPKGEKAFFKLDEVFGLFSELCEHIESTPFSFFFKDFTKEFC